MTETTLTNTSEPPIPRWPAILLLTHIVLLILLKSNRGQEAELLWISHVSLAIAGAGYLLRSTRLIAIAFVSIAALHMTWLFDAAVGLTTGSFPIGMAMYLPSSDIWTWAATSHHLYLTPLLAVTLWNRKVNVIGTFCTVFFLFLYLATVSRFFLDPAFNVNRAHQIFLGWDHHFAHNSNALPAIKYIPGLAATVTILFFLPSTIALRLLVRKFDEVVNTEKTHGCVNADSLSMDKPIHKTTAIRPRAFTLIELVAVMVVLAILSAVAIPKYFDYADRAKEAADEASIDDIQIAMSNAFLQHQINESPTNEWITTVTMIAPLMETNALPLGITINGARLEDQRGNEYTLTAETADVAARLTFIENVNPGNNFNGSGGGGS